MGTSTQRDDDDDDLGQFGKFVAKKASTVASPFKKKEIGKKLNDRVKYVKDPSDHSESRHVSYSSSIAVIMCFVSPHL